MTFKMFRYKPYRPIVKVHLHNLVIFTCIELPYGNAAVGVVLSPPLTVLPLDR